MAVKEKQDFAEKYGVYLFWGTVLILVIGWAGYSKFIQIHYEDTSETKPIPHSIQRVKDSDLLSGTSRVTQQGYDGSEIVHYRVGTKNGRVVSKAETSSSVTYAAQAEIIAVGTASVSNIATQTYWYCWNSGNPSPHHLGYPVSGDHYCTNAELHNAGFFGY